MESLTGYSKGTMLEMRLLEHEFVLQPMEILKVQLMAYSKDRSMVTLMDHSMEIPMAYWMD